MTIEESAYTGPDAPAASPRYPRKFRQRLLISMLVPVALLALAEGVLRLLDCGSPTSFFLPSILPGSPVLIANDDFSRRFLPAGMDRVASPMGIPVSKAPGELRVVVLGSSAAMGDPDPAFSIGRQVEVMLAARYPDRRITLVNTALTAINSHVVREIAEDLAVVRPDIVIVYTGNNEVVGPYGPGSALAPFEPSLWMIRARGLLLEWRLGQFIRTLLARAGITGGAGAWRGMKAFTAHQVAATDPRLEVVRENFEANLGAIVDSAREAGSSIVVFCTLPANLRDCAPFASAPRVNGAVLADWKRLVEEGDSAAARGDSGAALDSWRRAELLDGTDASLQYRIGRLHLDLGHDSAAEIFLERALALDRLRFRADRPMNEIIRRVASEEGVLLVDLEAALRAAARSGLPGAELLLDHVHLSFRGNYFAAREVMTRLEGYRPVGDPPAGNGILSETECAAALSFTPWDERLALLDIRKRMMEPPFTEQWDHAQSLARIDERIAATKTRPDTASLPQWIESYRRALVRRPDDPFLLERLAALLFEDGRPDESVVPLERLTVLWPEYEHGICNLAAAINATGRPADAEALMTGYIKRETAGGRPRRTLDTREALAEFLLSFGHEAAAVKVLDELIALEPVRVVPFLRYASLLLRARNESLRDPRKALDLVEEAIRRTGGQDRSILVLQAEALDAAGESARARELRRSLAQ